MGARVRVCIPIAFESSRSTTDERRGNSCATLVIKQNHARITRIIATRDVFRVRPPSIIWHRCRCSTKLSVRAKQGYNHPGEYNTCFFSFFNFLFCSFFSLFAFLSFALYRRIMSSLVDLGFSSSIDDLFLAIFLHQSVVLCFIYLCFTLFYSIFR